MAYNKAIPEPATGDVVDLSGIDYYQQMAHRISVSKGWWNGYLDNKKARNVPEMLALIHSEVSEALEEYREGWMEIWYSYQASGLVT